jgi:hypothetical protein
VVLAPGHSQSISSLMADMVMNAVTTPPHLPVFTGKTMWLNIDHCEASNAGAYFSQSRFRSAGSEWRRSCFRRYSRSKEEQALLHSCWCSTCYPCPRSSLKPYVSLRVSTGCDRPTPFSCVPVEMSSIGENARVIGEEIPGSLADRTWRARIE